MAIRKINPTSPGQRGMTKSDFAEITTDKPEKSLLKDSERQQDVIIQVESRVVIRVADIREHTV